MINFHKQFEAEMHKITCSDSKYHNFIASLLYGSWWKWPIVLMAGLAWLSTPLMILRSISSESIAWLGASGCLIVLGLSVFFLRKSLILQLKDKTGTIQLPPVWLAICIGLSLRIIWTALFSAEPASDGRTYIQLSLDLISQGIFETDGTKAYWPPGYPFFLMPWLSIFTVPVAIVTSQITLFILSCEGSYRLAKFLTGERTARAAVLLLALWPNLIAQTGIPSKEMLVLALLPWALFLTLKQSLWANFFAGNLLGFATLTQPSLQLLILGASVLIVLREGLHGYKGAILIMAGALLIISPWTLRNYTIFERIVLVSTNSGDVLYRANNPLADGGYTPRAAIDLSNLNEIDKDLASKKLAQQWIKENPLKFGILVLEKQIRFMGDDAIGVYETLKRGKASDNASLYLIFKLLANAWWLLIWFLFAALTQHHWRIFSPDRLLLWGWFYLFILHSIFESGGKYHVPMIWVLCIVLGKLLTTDSSESADDSQRART